MRNHRDMARRHRDPRPQRGDDWAGEAERLRLIHSGLALQALLSITVDILLDPSPRDRRDLETALECYRRYNKSEAEDLRARLVKGGFANGTP